MHGPPFDTNPLTKIWQLVTTSRILITNFPKYVKLVELTMVQMVGNMEDERCLSFLDLWNLSFIIGWQPNCCLLCRCLHNASVLYKISHMRSALSSGELPTIATTMMGNMWLMVFVRALRGPSKGYHFFMLIVVC
jgi:hypothetical protein